MKKLSPKEVEAVERIRDFTVKAKNCGPGNIKDGKSQSDKRHRKLLNLGVILYVGCSEKTALGYKHGSGLIPTDMFDPDFHTKLEI